jgi:uncharacterized protein
MTQENFVVAVHDLINKPGNLRRFDFEIKLDEPFGVGAVTLPKGSELQLSGRLESVHEGVLVTGLAESEAKTECSRCLDPLSLPVEVDFQELFAYSRYSEDDFEIQEEKIDLEPVVRDAVVLSLPFQPVCKESCLGLCAECGLKLADDPNHVHEAAIDSRWSELTKLQITEED